MGFDSPLRQAVIQELGAQIASTRLLQVALTQIHYDGRSVLTDPPVVQFSEDVGCPASSLRDGG